MLISPSQISTWMLCERKWGWGYIDKIRTPTHPKAELGTKVHNLLEEYNKHGTPIPDTEVFIKKRPGKIAMRALPHLPPPGTGIVEGDFQFKAHGHEWRGIIDLRLPPEIVIDFKTTGNIKKFALTPDTLAEDPQGIIYAAYAFSLDPKINRVILRWIYMNTSRDAKAKVVEATVTRDEVEARFKKLAQVADAVEAASHLSTLDLEPNPKACSAYGGCPHAQRCNLTNEQKLKGLFTMAESELTKRMKKLKAEKKEVEAAGGVHFSPQIGNPPAAATAQPINPPAIVAKDAAPTSAEIPSADRPGINNAMGVGDVKARLDAAIDQEAIEVLTDAVIKTMAQRLGNLMAKVE